MQLLASTADVLRRIGDGSSLRDVAASAGLTVDELHSWWAAETARRVPSMDGRRPAAVSELVEILRDGRGVPHVRAQNDADLFFGYGYAMAQDRLFAMDLRRRQGHGRLAELIGPDGLPSDKLARTIGLHLIARAELGRLGDETRGLLDAFAGGVNALIAASSDLPIEYDLLGAQPEPWSALDSVACAGSWRWQLTGRPHVVAAPELLKRDLGDGQLFQAILQASREADGVSILPPGSYPGRRAPWMPDASLGLGPDAAQGSNNWVVAGKRSASGRPILCSDPHMPYTATSSFYEVCLRGGSFDLAGAGFLGLPGVAFGRNRRTAWGITNNICSLRDLYAETTDEEHPDAFLYEGDWKPADARDERIGVAGADDVVLTVRSSRHGPIVDEILPPPAQGTGPVSMRWLGAGPCDWIAAQLRLNRADSVEDAQRAVRGWLVPTFSLMLADVDDHIGYQATGAIPIREIPERGYRPGWDRAHEWSGLIPPEGMPQTADPERGWLASANNRPAPDDFPHPLSGTWDEGYRAGRIGELIETAGELDRDGMGLIQSDVHANRAAATLASLITLLEPAPDERSGRAIELLRRWDHRATIDSAAGAFYEVLFVRWTQAVAAERLPPERSDYLAAWLVGLAARLLEDDEIGWFRADRRSVARRVLGETMDELVTRLGPDPDAWRWGELHRLTLRHPLSGRGELGELLDKPPVAVPGDLSTINNSGFEGGRISPDLPGYDRNWEATSGAGYRLVADLGVSPAEIWTITGESQSGHPGSPHWNDQLDDFLAGRYRRIPMEDAAIEATAETRFTLEPEDR